MLVEVKGRRDSRTVRGKLLLLTSSLRPLQLIRSESQYSHDSKVTWAAVVSTTCSLSVSYGTAMCELTNHMAGERHGRGMLCVNRPLLCHRFVV